MGGEAGGVTFLAKFKKAILCPKRHIFHKKMLLFSQNFFKRHVFPQVSKFDFFQVLLLFIKQHREKSIFEQILTLILNHAFTSLESHDQVHHGKIERETELIELKSEEEKQKGVKIEVANRAGHQVLSVTKISKEKK